MFSEAYIIFSLGQIKVRAHHLTHPPALLSLLLLIDPILTPCTCVACPALQPFQKNMFPNCFKHYMDGCDANLVKNQSYIQICGIIAGKKCDSSSGMFCGLFQCVHCS